jgi:hypothetical protein
VAGEQPRPDIEPNSSPIAYYFEIYFNVPQRLGAEQPLAYPPPHDHPLSPTRKEPNPASAIALVTAIGAFPASSIGLIVDD